MSEQDFHHSYIGVSFSSFPGCSSTGELTVLDLRRADAWLFQVHETKGTYTTLEMVAMGHDAEVAKLNVYQSETDASMVH